jgi:hypothetical protein
MICGQGKPLTPPRLAAGVALGVWATLGCGSIELAETRELVVNGDFEQVQDAKPRWWNGGGTVPVEFVAMGPSSSDAATGEWYGRVGLSEPGIGWIFSEAAPVSGGQPLYVNAYVRSNMQYVQMDVHEYDAQRQELWLTSGPQVTAPDWRWRRYPDAGGSFSVELRSSTRYVVVAVAGATATALPAYIDVDAVSTVLR